MWIEGRLTDWDERRGYGYLTPTQGGQPIFVGRDVYPREGGMPFVGEALRIVIMLDRHGVKRACKVERLLTPEQEAHAPLHAPRHTRGSGWHTLAVLGGLAALLYWWIS